jgi:hypothetical protein
VHRRNTVPFWPSRHLANSEEHDSDIISASSRGSSLAELVCNLVRVLVRCSDADVNNLLVGEAAATPAVLIGEEPVAADNHLHGVLRLGHTHLQTQSAIQSSSKRRLCDRGDPHDVLWWESMRMITAYIKQIGARLLWALSPVLADSAALTVSSPFGDCLPTSPDACEVMQEQSICFGHCKNKTYILFLQQSECFVFAVTD